MPIAAEGRTPPPDAVVRFRVERKEEALVLHCIGALVLPNFQRLDEMIREVKSAAGARKIVLNLKQVDRMDSVGVGTLSMILKHAMSSAIVLTLVSNDYVKQVLESSGLDRVFKFAASVEDALSEKAA
jgi:anti-anti-sigma factor